MLILLALPVVVAVAGMHRYLAMFAPTNVLIRSVRAHTRCSLTVLILAAIATLVLVATNLVAGAVANGGPGWLNLVVLVLAWDAIKVSCLTAGVGLRVVGSAVATVGMRASMGLRGAKFARPGRIILRRG